MDAAGKFNLRNPAVKRILQEMKEMQQDNASEFVAEALEDNIFEWHFVIRGPPDTEFEGGLYHGRILLPSDYPFKPPSFVMLTPSGRFEVGKKICLSISERHPEHWQPSWSMRTALMALVAFLPTKGKGAIGSLDFPEADRRSMAKKSQTFVPVFANEERQKVATMVHNRALERGEAKARENVALQQGDSIQEILDTLRPAPQENLAAVTSDSSQDASQTINSVAEVRSRTASQEGSNPPVNEQGTRETNEAVTETAMPGIEVTTPWVSGADTEQTDVEQLHGNVRDKEWIWSTAMWAVGFLIVALVAKKVLVRAGVDVWAFIE
ncbi:hypothetical protein BSKO_00969 [Bryopsis sp. KO-2023]|nr:hypothetical protein BSKO_00969 [Bryopsis sp. KO-2023]